MDSPKTCPVGVTVSKVTFKVTVTLLQSHIQSHGLEFWGPSLSPPPLHQPALCALVVNWPIGLANWLMSCLGKTVVTVRRKENRLFVFSLSLSLSLLARPLLVGCVRRQLMDIPPATNLPPCGGRVKVWSPESAPPRWVRRFEEWPSEKDDPPQPWPTSEDFVQVIPPRVVVRWV